MREIIGENLKTFFNNIYINATKTHSCNIGYWPNFEVWELSEVDYKKICDMSDEEYEQVAADDSWWRGAEGSNMGVPSYEFIINGKKIMAWYNDYKDRDLIEDFDQAVCDGEEVNTANNLLQYIETFHPMEYKDLLEYFYEEIGASTERNVCVLATDLAKYNGITMAELFRRYGGSKNENN